MGTFGVDIADLSLLNNYDPISPGGESQAPPASGPGGDSAELLAEMEKLKEQNKRLQAAADHSVPKDFVDSLRERHAVCHRAEPPLPRYDTGKHMKTCFISNHNKYRTRCLGVDKLALKFLG
jgi:hypothetical protein